MIRVAIIEDNRLVREGIAAMLNEQADVTVSYSAPEGNLEIMREANPQVLLLDVGLAGDDSLSLAERLRNEMPETRVVVMDLLPVDKDLVEFVNVGVSGFVLKDATFEELLSTIRSVANGDSVLPQEMASSLFSRIANAAVLQGHSVVNEETSLTPREREVVELIGQGMSNKTIARNLGVSPHTVKSHVRNVMDKLALHTRLQIAVFLHAAEDKED